jgi:hypothetical protein
MSKPFRNRRQCQAFVSSTKEQCKKVALRGSRYCWHHQSKLPLLAALLLGTITSLFIPKIWEILFPSKALQRIESNTEQIPDLAENIIGLVNTVESSAIDVLLSFAVSDPNLRQFDGRMVGKVAVSRLLTKSGSSLTYKSSSGDVRMMRSQNRYEFRFKTVLAPEDNVYREDASEFYGAQKIIVPLGQFVSRIKIDASEGCSPILTGVKVQFFVNNVAVNSREYPVSHPVDETNNIEIQLREP